MRIAIIGWQGFVGSAFARLLESQGVSFTGVDRSNYASHAGIEWDIAILAAANSKKFVAEERPLADLEQSLELTSRILRDFPAQRQPNPVNVGKGILDLLFVRDFDTNETGHKR